MSDRQSSGRWFWIGLSVLLLAVGGGVFALLTWSGEEAGGREPSPVLVRAATVAPASELVIRQTGFIRPRREVEVAPEVSGRIATVGDGFVLGGRIAEGDLLIALERERFEADVAQAEAGVQRAEAQLAQARVDRDRQAELEERNFASEARLQEAIVDVAAAEANLATARANLTAAEVTLEDTVVRAPFDALVVAESAAVGQLVTQGQGVGRIVAADAVEVEMGLTPSDLDVLDDPALALGGRVLVNATTGAAGMLAQGVVTEVDPQVQANTRTIALVVRIDDPFEGPGRVLQIDELVELVLPVSLENRRAVEVPAEAVKEGRYVWHIEPDGEASVLRRREVVVLDRLEDRVVLSAGVAAGAQVMVSDLVAPFDGKRVRVDDGASEARTAQRRADGS